MTQADDFVGKQVKVLLTAAVIGDGDTQAVLSMQSGIRWRSDSLLVELDQDLLVQYIELFIIKSAGIKRKQTMSRTTGASSSMVGSLCTSLRKVMCLFHVARDHATEPVKAMLLDRHPDLEGAVLTLTAAAHSH